MHHIGSVIHVIYKCISRVSCFLLLSCYLTMRRITTVTLVFISFCCCADTLLLYELDHADQALVFNPGESFLAKDVLGFCYRYQGTWAQGDDWRMDLSDGYIAYRVYETTIVDNKIRRVFWDFNAITSVLDTNDPPVYFPLRWNNVCYMINFLEKSVSSFYNGKLVVKDFPDGLKNIGDSINITRITVLKNKKAMITDMSLFSVNVTPEQMIEFTECQSEEEESQGAEKLTAWQVLDSEGAEINTTTTSEESVESMCHWKPYFLILPLQGLWPGKEKCNLLGGKLYNYFNDTERIKFTAWVQAWHKKRGGKQVVGLDLSDDEEEGIWKSTETGQVIAVIEKLRPDRVSETIYENWRPGQPNGGRTQNMISFDAYYDKRGWVDYDTDSKKHGWMTCQVGSNAVISLQINTS